MMIVAKVVVAVMIIIITDNISVVVVGLFKIINYSYSHVVGITL